MTQSKPQLCLNRLVVVSHLGLVAFDEHFHKGVNIIRGQNSSGKSTIANFIFYVLGGDFSNWTSEALKCHEVLAEIEVNGAVITIKRKIVDKAGQPMSFYWGPYLSASSDSLNWQTYSYRQTDNRVSFSNVMFNALSFPIIKDDADSNITLHQILRLLYVDQETPTLNLFRFERFDLPLTRQVVSELLLGVYDDSLYSNRLDLREIQKELIEKKKEFEGLRRVYGGISGVTSVGQVEKEIEELNVQISSNEEEIDKLRKRESVRTTSRTALNSENAQAELIPVKEKVRDLQSEINRYNIEIADSQQFIATLEKRISELTHSLATRKILGELPITHCPQCLNPLSAVVDNEHCHLCKQPVGEEAEKANAKRLLQEMDLQVKESKHLLRDKEDRRNGLESELPRFIEKARALQKTLDRSLISSQSTRDGRIDLLLVNRGRLEQKHEIFQQQLQAVHLLQLLAEEVNVLTARIQGLTFEIQEKEQIQRRKFETALSMIQKETVHLLRNDLNRQSEFRSGQHVEVDFKRDYYTLDGNNNFSASSKVYFKNSVLFAIFFASLNLEFFRYPRFILCDNMEDKGMEKERTQNLQKLIVRLSEQHGSDHQIIFTTSMIAEELNSSAFCVGDEYDSTNKTLRV